MIEEKYEEYLKYELNYSSNTIESYINHINKYLEYLKYNNINYLKMRNRIII